MKPPRPQAVFIPSKSCLFHSPPSRPSACLALVRTSTKGLPFQLVTVLFMAVQKHFPGSVPSDTDNDDDTNYEDAAAYDSDN